MRLTIWLANKTIFPSEVLELFQVLYDTDFFEDSMLIGSWVMPIYQEAFGIPYSLRTFDIDFAVKMAAFANVRKVDLEAIITGLGYIPITMQSGVRKFTRQNLAIEFVSHRKGGRNEEVEEIKKWNITAVPLPFVDILLDFALIANFGDFQVRAPIPEAYFVQKLIAAQRRPDVSKKDKDLEQCSVIAGHIDPGRLAEVVGSLKLSVKTRKSLRISCTEIGFPPQSLGLH